MSLRELEDNCKVNIRFMYLMENERPTYRTFGYFINEVLDGSIEEIFYDINQKIFETEQVDLNIFILMAPNLKRMQTSTPLYGRKRRKNQGIVFLKRLPFFSMRSIRHLLFPK